MESTSSPSPVKTGCHYFELTNSYDAGYNWFDHLKTNGHYITIYVILPNHLHVLIGFKALKQSIIQL
jgi:hypothetical protein